MSRQEIERLVEEYQLVTELLGSLQAQLGVIAETLEELGLALDGVKLLKSGDSGEKLLHLGAGLYVRGNFVVAEVLTPVGANYYAFLPLNEAERIVTERIEENTRLRNSIEENIDRLAQRAGQIRATLERLGVIRQAP